MLRIVRKKIGVTGQCQAMGSFLLHGCSFGSAAQQVLRLLFFKLEDGPKLE